MSAFSACINVALILVGGIFATGGGWAAACTLWLLVFLDVADDVIEAIKAKGE